MTPTDRGLGFKKKKLKEASMPTTNHLLVIGINAYDNGIPKLNNAIRDAKTVEALLKEKYDFKEENIIGLYDTKASKDNILEAFDQLIKKLTTNDSLILYFSGHGELVEEINRGYWIPVEARQGRRGSYINNTEIKDFVSACKARHILGIVDACYSGSLLRKISSSELQKYFTKPSRKIMTSGLIEPVPDGPPNNHSPFAAALINALKYNNDAFLSSSDLWQAMKPGLSSNSSATAQFEAMHDVGHQGGDFYFLSAHAEDIPVVEKIAIAEGEVSRKINPENTPAPKPVSIPKPKEEDLSTLSDSEWKTAIKRLAVTNLKRALTKTEDRIDASSDAFNSLLLIQSRFHSAKKNQEAGLVTEQQSNISFNRIKAAFSSFIDDLEDYDMK